MTEVPSTTSEFECPVCFEEFSGHIYQCNEGHPLCHECYPKFTKCPTCQTPLSGNIRNRILEQIISSKSNNNNNNPNSNNSNTHSNSNSNNKETNCSMDDDIEFQIGKEHKSFYGMRAMFAAQSEVLKQNLSKDNKVIIEDVTEAAWHYFHELVYFKKPTLTYDIVIDVLYLAQKYSIKHLMEECQNNIINVNDIPSCHLILKGFDKYSSSIFFATFNTFFSEFMKKSSFTKTNAMKIMQHGAFNKSVSPTMFNKILDLDYIEDNTEFIYTTCKEYCEFHAQIDKNISWKHMFKLNFIEHFNFVEFTLDFILTVLRNDGILSSDHLLNIINDKYDNNEIQDIKMDTCVNNNNNNNNNVGKEENSDQDRDCDKESCSDRSRSRSRDRGRRNNRFDKHNKFGKHNKSKWGDRDRHRNRGKYNKFDKFNKHNKFDKRNKFNKHDKYNKFDKYDKYNKHDKHNKYNKFNKYKKKKWRDRSGSRSDEEF